MNGRATALNTAFKTALIVAMVFAILLPVLGTGWFGDDAYYSYLPAAMHTGRLSLAGAAWNSYTAWLASSGRWHPGLIIETYATFALFHDRVAYKIALIVVSLVALWTAWRYLCRLWNASFAFLAILATVACFQVRGYHDPFLAYNGLIQVFAICLFVSLGTFLAFAEGGGRFRIAASIALYAIACSVYEIGYIVAPLYYFTATSREAPRASLAASAPFAAIGVAFFAVTAALRAHAHVDPASMYAISADPRAYAIGLFDQITAAIPLSYLFFNPSRIFTPPWTGFGIPFEPLALVAAAICAYFVLPETPVEPNARVRGSALALGISLVIFPAIEIPALLKYQHELLFGLGYLPVFLEYFGTGISIAVALANVRFTGAARVVAVAAFAGFATVSAGANAKLAEVIALPYLTSRESFESAVTGGLLAHVPPGAKLAIVPEYPWVCHDGECIDDIRTSDMVSDIAKRPVAVVPLASAAYVVRFDPERATWSLDRAPKP